MASGIVRKQGLLDKRAGQHSKGERAQARLLRTMRNPPFYRACFRRVAARRFARGQTGFKQVSSRLQTGFVGFSGTGYGRRGGLERKRSKVRPGVQQKCEGGAQTAQRRRPSGVWSQR
jgi:hypothetical protein